MKRCAKCDREYADDYDGCPYCAKAAVKPPAKKSGGCGAIARLIFLPFAALIAYLLLSVVFNNAAWVGWVIGIFFVLSLIVTLLEVFGVYTP